MTNMQSVKRGGGVQMKNIALAVFLIFILLGFSNFLSAQTNIIPTNQDGQANGVGFGVRIVDFESPAKLGDFMEFTYRLRSVSNLEDYVVLNFWIEKDGKTISSGSDTIYIQDIEAREETTKIFLPSSVETGIYDLDVELDYKGYKVRAHRTMELTVSKGFATINYSGENSRTLIIVSLLVLAILISLVIYYLERKRVNQTLAKEKGFIKSHKLLILVISLFLILGALMYYLNFVNFAGTPTYFYYALLGFLLFFVLLRIALGKAFRRFKKKR